MDSGGGGVLARWPERAGVVWLLVALFLMMLGLAKGIPPLLLLSATLVAAFLVNVLFASFPLRRLEAGITEDGDLVAGEPGLVVFQVWSANPVSSSAFKTSPTPESKCSTTSPYKPRADLPRKRSGTCSGICGAL